MRFLLFVLAGVLAFCGAVFAGDIAITGVTVTQGAGDRPTAEITINNSLIIRDIRVVTVGERRMLKFPEYVSRSRRVYPQAALVTRQALEAAQRAVEARRPSTGEAPALAYRVKRFSLIRKTSRLKAVALVSFNDAVEVECKVFGGKNGPWVAWPSRRSKARGQWDRQVELTDKRLREAVEQDILCKYETMTAEAGEE